MTKLLLGDEAVALAAVHSGIAGAFSYPGTPATEIFEFIERSALDGAPVSARWSTNEKVAYEEALGMSFVGKRALVSMKHVGLNVAADPFMSSALTGANGGLVVAVLRQVTHLASALDGLRDLDAAARGEVVVLGLQPLVRATGQLVGLRHARGGYRHGCPPAPGVAGGLTRPGRPVAVHVRPAYRARA